MVDVIAAPSGGSGPQRGSGGIEASSQIISQTRVSALSTSRGQPMKPGSGSISSTHFGTMSFGTQCVSPGQIDCKETLIDFSICMRPCALV